MAVKISRLVVVLMFLSSFFIISTFFSLLFFLNWHSNDNHPKLPTDNQSNVSYYINGGYKSPLIFPVESLEERLYYNLLPLSHRQEEKQEWHCTVELINTRKLQQDHPCVIDIIKKLFLHRPNVIHNSYRLDRDKDIDPSVGQARTILRHLLLQVIWFINLITD